MGAGTELAKVLFPSRAAMEEDHVYRWRVFVALALWGNIMSFTVFTLLVFGIIQIFGFSGFATKAEAQAQQQLLKDIRVSQLENQLRDYRAQQCQAQMEGNLLALQLATSNLREKGNLYWMITGRVYTPEDCSALLVVVRPTPLGQSSN